MERAIFYDFVWYTKNERDFLTTINDTSYQISMICRNLKMICKSLDEVLWDESETDKIKLGIKEIENEHIKYVSNIKIDEL